MKQKVLSIVSLIVLAGMFVFAIYSNFFDKENTTEPVDNLQNEESENLNNDNDNDKNDESDSEEVSGIIIDNKVIDDIDLSDEERFIVYDGTKVVNDIIREHDLILLELRAEWCKYCKELESRFDEILEGNKDLVILQIDIDEYPELGRKYMVVGTPTLVVYKEQELSNSTSGALPTDMLLQWIDKGTIY